MERERDGSRTVPRILQPVLVANKARPGCLIRDPTACENQKHMVCHIAEEATHRIIQGPRRDKDSLASRVGPVHWIVAGVYVLMECHRLSLLSVVRISGPETPDWCVQVPRSQVIEAQIRIILLAG